MFTLYVPEAECLEFVTKILPMQLAVLQYSCVQVHFLSAVGDNLYVGEIFLEE